MIFFIDSLLSYSLGNNFDELFIPPVDTYPNQVRSDIKDYLKGLDNGIAIRKLNVNKFSKFGSNNYSTQLLECLKTCLVVWF